jgi:hypothetical protein
MHQAEMEKLNTIVIGVTSKQWGSRADFGWCATYQGNNQQNPLGSGASSVMITSSYNDRTRLDLHAIQAGLIYRFGKKKCSTSVLSRTMKPY